MKVEVVTVTNRAPSEPYYIFDKFYASLARFGYEPTILGWNEPWHGLMTKPRRLRQWLAESRQRADCLIVCDSWDIVFADHPDEVYEAYRDHPVFGDAVVFNAERNCFPRPDLAPRFPDPGTPWRYLNSGFMMGPASVIARILAHMNLDTIPDDHRRGDGSWFHPNDQEHYTLTFLDQPVPMMLDTECELCQSCSGCDLGDFGVFDGQILNWVTGTIPLVFHFNGGSKNDVMPYVLKHLKL